MKHFLTIILIVIISACGAKKQDNISDNKVLTNNESVSEKTTSKARILFFGNSLTAAYGLSPEEAFSHLIQQKIDSLNLNYECINAGLSGETTAGGLERVDWLLKEKVDVFVLELGANDGLRGLPLKESKQNLISIINKVKEAWPNARILLVGMQVPPNLGEDYANEFKEMYPAIQNETQVALLPFLLKDVAGNPDLNLPDGIHPTAEGHKILAETVWDALFPIL